MKAFYFILPSILILGGFIGLALGLTGTGWAVILGLFLYPTGFSYTESNVKEKDNDNK